MTVSLDSITKRVGQETHIHPTSLTFEPGVFNCLLGATNAGKTTLIKLMAGLEKPTGGQVSIAGRNVTRISPQKRNVSLVHQFFVNYPNMTVLENIASPLRVAGMAEAEIKARVDEAVDLLRLGPYTGRKPAELSGGQQQRTALARAIVKDSDLVLLDEPLANLDYKLREELRDQLPRLFADRGAVVVYATSEPLEALLLGGHTATLREGRVTQFGPTAQIYRQPADLATAEVFSDPPINATEVTKRGAEIHLGNHASWTAAGAIASAPDGAYRMGIRPHYILPEERPGTVPVLGQVQIAELTGSESVAHFELAGGAWVSQAAGVHPYRVGEAHRFHLDPAGCLYFAPDGQRIG